MVTTAELENVEIVLYIDADDAESQNISDPLLSIVKIVGPSGQTMGKMNTACYEASHGRYVMLINDDVIFRTSEWDRRVMESFSLFPDDVGLIYGNDLDQGSAVPTFPIISRVVCDLVGEICPRGYWNLHIESHLFDLFRQLAKRGYDRIRYLDDLVFEHMHYVVGKADYDSTYKKKNQRFDHLLFMALDDERALKAKLLARYIKSRAGSHLPGTDGCPDETERVVK
jgi:hypothetical protein